MGDRVVFGRWLLVVGDEISIELELRLGVKLLVELGVTCKLDCGRSKLC